MCLASGFNQAQKGVELQVFTVGSLKKNAVFCHLHPLKMVQNPGHAAKKMRLESLRPPRAFQARCETTFDPLKRGLKSYRWQKFRILFLKKKTHTQLKSVLPQIPTLNFFQLEELDLSRNSCIVLHSSAANLFI